MKLRIQKSVPVKCLTLVCGALSTLLFSPLAASASAGDSSAKGSARESIASPLSPPVPYADLADLAGPAGLVVKAQVRKVAPVEPDRARGVRSGWSRVYIEAKTEAVLGGRTALGEALRYLVDLPLDAKGKLPKLAKRSVIIFAQPVAARPGELQLVAPDAQLMWDPALEARLKSILTEFYAAGAPPAVTGLREAIHVSGALAGEGESQFFLATATGNPAAITVVRSSGGEARWSVSFSELVETGAPPPARDTLAWYRLACFLPGQLPQGTILSTAADDRAAAVRDYRFVIEQLGSCSRLRR